MNSYTLEKAETLDYLDEKLREFEALAENMKFIALSLQEFVADDPQSHDAATRLLNWVAWTREMATDVTYYYSANIR